MSSVDGILEAWLRAPDHPTKLRVLTWIIRRLRKGRIQLDAFGSTFEVNLNDYIGQRLFYEGCYEPKSVELALRLMQKGGTFVDVGANFGLYTLPISDIPGTRVVAIEPNETSFLSLRTNLALNCRYNVDSCNLALSSEPSILSFHVPSLDNIGSSRVEMAPTERQNDGSRVYRAATTITTLLSTLSVGHVDLLKIDVEGHELKVLADLERDTRLLPTNMICEYRLNDQEAPLQPTPLIDFLRRAGYQLFDVEGRELSMGDQIPEANLWLKRAVR